MTVPEILDYVVITMMEISHELEMDAVFQLELQGEPSETYQLIIKGKRIEWLTGKPMKATCTIQVSHEHFIKLVEGNLNPTTALLTGKIKIWGDRTQLIKLQSLLSKDSIELPWLF